MKANCPDPWIVPEKGSGCFLHSNESMNFFEAEEVKANEYLDKHEKLNFKIWE